MPSGAPGNARDRRWRPPPADFWPHAGWSTPRGPGHPPQTPARPCPMDKWSAAPAPRAERCFARPSHNPGPDHARCSPARKTWSPHAQRWRATFGSPAPMPGPGCTGADSCDCSARPPSTPPPQTPSHRCPSRWPKRCVRESGKKPEKIETGPETKTACAPQNEQTILLVPAPPRPAWRRRNPRRSPAELHPRIDNPSYPACAPLFSRTTHGICALAIVLNLADCRDSPKLCGSPTA
ncbi:UNVERIFIED_ORG: hypothetical protein HNP28_001860 [Comamonas terrigena]